MTTTEEIDRKIIDDLTKDARKSFRSMAKELDRSPDTVINHYQKMQGEGLIRGSTVIIEPRMLGYEGTVAFHVDVTSSGPGKTDPTSILKSLSKMPNIIVATKTVGDHDLLAIGVIHDFEHLMKLGREIAEIPGVANIQTAMWASRGPINPRFFII